MAFIREKIIKGHSYRYLVEGYREGGKVKQRTLKYLGQAPVLNKDAPIAVVLLAGGGAWNVVWFKQESDQSYQLNLTQLTLNCQARLTIPLFLTTLSRKFSTPL